MNKKIFFKFVRPQGFSLFVAGLAFFIFLAGLLISILATLDPVGGLEVSIELLGLFFIPLTGILLFVAALVSRRAGPRFALGVVVLFLMLVESIAFSVAVYIFEPDKASLLAIFAFVLFLFCPGFLIALIPLFIALPKLPAELKAAIFEGRCEYALDFLSCQDDVVTYRDLAHYLKTSESEVQRVLIALLERGQIKGTPYPQYGLYLEPWVVRRKLRELKALVALRGQVSFADLAGEFRVPPEIVEDWLADAAAEGEFPGYVHWEEKTLYSEEAETLRDFGHCPKCGGELRLAGKGVIHCTYCGYDIFLKKPASNKNAKKRSAPKPPKDDTTPQT